MASTRRKDPNMAIDTSTVRNGEVTNDPLELLDGLLTRDAILAAQDLKFDTVEVPEWGGRVRVMALSGKERDRFEASIWQTNGKNREANMQNLRAKLVALSVVDKTNKRLFEDRDVALLTNKSAAALERVYSVAAKLSGISPSDAEELAKNSEGGLNADSTSDSL
jgi:hypothetical protein